MRTIQEARQIIADLATKDGEHTFAREVLAGCWDHRSDVKAALSPDFKPKVPA
jgi:hypothetical protein